MEKYLRKNNILFYTFSNDHSFVFLSGYDEGSYAKEFDEIQYPVATISNDSDFEILNSKEELEKYVESNDWNYLIPILITLKSIK